MGVHATGVPGNGRGPRATRRTVRPQQETEGPENWGTEASHSTGDRLREPDPHAGPLGRGGQGRELRGVQRGRLHTGNWGCCGPRWAIPANSWLEAEQARTPAAPHRPRPAGSHPRRQGCAQRQGGAHAPQVSRTADHTSARGAAEVTRRGLGLGAGDREVSRQRGPNRTHTSKQSTARRESQEKEERRRTELK